MLRHNSQEFRTFFLLEFTKQLLRNSKVAEEEIVGLKEVIKEEEKEIKKEEVKIKKEYDDALKREEKKKRKKIKGVVKERKTFDLSEIKKSLYTPSKVQIAQKAKKRVLKIPSAKIPKHFEYLKPTSTSNIAIDLGKLNSFVKDPLIKEIECNGPDTNITIRGTAGGKKTNILLKKEEIDDVIKKFADAAKTPVKEGLFTVSVGRMTLTAVVSEITGSRFVIKKMIYNPVMKK